MPEQIDAAPQQRSGSPRTVLIIDGGVNFAFSGGKLNHTLAETAAEFLRSHGFEVSVTTIENGYNVEEELKKFLEAGIIIYQFPGWWMYEPWNATKYLTEVFQAGYGQLWKDDGRDDNDPTKKYGTGGLAQGKKYLISSTWNAPEEAFVDPNQFFKGVGSEGLWMHLHKINQFLGMTPLPSFMCTDVVKMPDVPRDIERLKDHLRTALVN